MAFPLLFQVQPKFGSKVGGVGEGEDMDGEEEHQPGGLHPLPGAAQQGAQHDNFGNLNDRLMLLDRRMVY